MKKYIFWTILMLVISSIVIIAIVSWKSRTSSAIDTSEKIPSCPNCNVIMISLDTLRAKSLPCFGYEKNTAPFLCDFASKSFTFTNTYSQSTYTLDSHMSLFTSLYPTSHGVVVPYVNTLSKNVVTLTEVLKENGYRTYYFGLGKKDNPWLPLSSGLGRGFDTVISADDPQSWRESLQNLDLSSGKFFAFFHTYAVHHQYVPKPESVQKLYGVNIPVYETWYKGCKPRYLKIKAIHPELFPVRQRGPGYNYCNEIVQFYLREGVDGTPGDSLLESEPLYADFEASYSWITKGGKQASEFGAIRKTLYESKIIELDSELELFFQFLQGKKLLEKSIVIIFGDHGEELFEHGIGQHGEQLYNETIHVPLIVFLPNAPPKRIDSLAQLIDVVPTVLPILSIPVPVQAQGINLLSGARNFYVFSEISKDSKRTIIDENRKLIVNHSNQKSMKTRELYELKNDPEEKQNLVNEKKHKADTLENTLSDYVAKWKMYEPTVHDFPSDLDQDDRRRLLQTGYR